MYLARAKERFVQAGIARVNPVQACTRDEVDEFERRCGKRLPEAYREFLLWIGHGAEPLFAGTDIYFDMLDGVQKGAEELLSDDAHPNLLPSDAFVFSLHQGTRFHFFRLGEGDDPPVYFYAEGMDSFDRVAPTFSSYVDSIVEWTADHLDLFEP